MQVGAQVDSKDIAGVCVCIYIYRYAYFADVNELVRRVEDPNVFRARRNRVSGFVDSNFAVQHLQEAAAPKGMWTWTYIFN